MFECENMTPFGCERMDAVKELMLFEQIESDIELDLNNICKRQCCKDCDNKCSYECGRVKYLDPVEQFKKEEIGQVSYKQLSFFQGVKSMNTIPEFVKQGFLQEYRCIYSGFEDDLDKIKGKENKIDFFKQEFSTSRYGCYEANKNLNCFLGLNSKNKGIKIIYKKDGKIQDKIISYKTCIEWIEESKQRKIQSYEQLSFF